jgi:hypothetical protein
VFEAKLIRFVTTLPVRRRLERRHRIVLPHANLDGVTVLRGLDVARSSTCSPWSMILFVQPHG